MYERAMKTHNLVAINIFALAILLAVIWFNTRPVGPSSDVTYGFDVSHYQGTIQWDSIDTSRYDFSIAKATGGTDYIDPDFSVNWNGMKERGLIRGAYHYFYPNESATQQVQNYLNTVKGLQESDLPPIIDIEVSNGLDAKTIVQGLLTWLVEVEKATQRRPMIYSDLNFAQTYLTDESLSAYPLWIADYNDTVGDLPKPWQASGWRLWQYSDSGALDGIEGAVDQDKFQGDKKALKAFIKSTVVSK